MSDPEPRFDGSFSEPGATATPWAETRAMLESAQLGWLTTVRADGRPHVTPLVPVWLDDALHFCTGSAEQKARNLATHPEVALSIGASSWSGGLDVVVEGTARRVTDRALLERLAAAWATKWDGDWQYQVTDDGFGGDAGGAWVFAVAPTKVLAFGKKPYSQTGYRL